MTLRSSRVTYAVVALLALAGLLYVLLLTSGRFIFVPDPAFDTVPRPFVMYRTLAPDAHGRVAMMQLTSGAQPRISDLSCVRLHYASGRGLCATYEDANQRVRHVAYVFDDGLTRGARIELDGVPTRLRVAPTGRIGAITTYGEEESAAGERLASQTWLVDMHSGRSVADLGEFQLQPHAFPAVEGPTDISSVAFERDGDRFFATLATETERYLVAGAVSERRLTLLRSGLASEALSPDGRRLAVKRLDTARGYWQLAVLDLMTWQERDLPQDGRSVDDQVEWLDDEHVVYHDADGESTSLWVVAIDGASAPRVLVRHAYSATVQR